MISRTMRRNSRKEPLLPAFSCSNSSPLPQRCCRAAFAHQREDLARRLRSRRPHSALTDCSRIARSSAGDEFDRVCLAQASRLARAGLAQTKHSAQGLWRSRIHRISLAQPARFEDLGLGTAHNRRPCGQPKPGAIDLDAACPYPSPQRIGSASSPAREIIGADPSGLYKRETKRVTAKARHCAGLPRDLQSESRGETQL